MICFWLKGKNPMKFQLPLLSLSALLLCGCSGQAQSEVAMFSTHQVNDYGVYESCQFVYDKNSGEVLQGVLTGIIPYSSLSKSGKVNRQYVEENNLEAEFLNSIAENLDVHPEQLEAHVGDKEITIFYDFNGQAELRSFFHLEDDADISADMLKDVLKTYGHQIH
jgi:hypothetical protein